MVPIALLAALAVRVGPGPFVQAGHVLTPGPIAAALLLGLVVTLAQALRWRGVAQAYQGATGLTRGRAVRECYRSAFLNTALPGGLAGDAVRAWRRGAQERERGGGAPRGRRELVRSAAGPVVVERAVGCVLLMAAAAVAALPVDRRLAGLLLVVAAAAAAVAVPGLAALPVRARALAVGWSAVALTALLAKVAVTAATLGTVHGPGQVIGLGLFVLTGGSVPVGFGGFGARETAAAYAFAASGLTAASGVATSVGYGLLAMVSVLPGAVVMLVDARSQPRWRRSPVAVADRDCDRAADAGARR